jgi:hypothetical protein
MLAPTPAVPLKYWCLAMSYACITQSFNYSSRIDDSPYHFTTGQHFDIRSLHPFWARVYVHIPLKHRAGKVGHPRAYQGHFVGYLYTSLIFDNFIVLEVHENGTYGKIRHSKDVIFDTSINFLHPDPNTFPEDEAFFPVLLDPVPLLPETPEVVEDVIEAPIESAAPPEPPSLPSTTLESYIPIAGAHHTESNKDNDPVLADPDAVYWYNTFVNTHEYAYSMVETTHINHSIAIKDPDVPKTFWAAMRIPEWAAAINKERG